MMGTPIVVVIVAVIRVVCFSPRTSVCIFYQFDFAIAFRQINQMISVYGSLPNTFSD